MKKFAIILNTTMKFLFVPIMAAGTGSTKNNIIVERGDFRMFQATTAATALDAPDGTEIKIKIWLTKSIQATKTKILGQFLVTYPRPMRSSRFYISEESREELHKDPTLGQKRLPSLHRCREPKN